jgi:hypothetical protein
VSGLGLEVAVYDLYVTAEVESDAAEGPIAVVVGVRGVVVDEEVDAAEGRPLGETGGDVGAILVAGHDHRAIGTGDSGVAAMQGNGSSSVPGKLGFEKAKEAGERRLRKSVPAREWLEPPNLLILLSCYPGAGL